MPANVSFMTVTGPLETYSPESIRSEDIALGGAGALGSIVGEYARITTDENCRIGVGVAPAADGLLLIAGQSIDLGPFTLPNVNIHVVAA